MNMCNGQKLTPEVNLFCDSAMKQRVQMWHAFFVLSIFASCWSKCSIGPTESISTILVGASSGQMWPIWQLQICKVGGSARQFGHGLVFNLSFLTIQEYRDVLRFLFPFHPKILLARNLPTMCSDFALACRAQTGQSVWRAHPLFSFHHRSGLAATLRQGSQTVICK